MAIQTSTLIRPEASSDTGMTRHWNKCIGVCSRISLFCDAGAVLHQRHCLHHGRHPLHHRAPGSHSKPAAHHLRQTHPPLVLRGRCRCHRCHTGSGNSTASWDSSHLYFTELSSERDRSGSRGPASPARWLTCSRALSSPVMTWLLSHTHVPNKP